MSLAGLKYPLPVGSFSKTNPPKNLALPLRNPLPPKYIKARFHVRNGGFVSQKHMFVRTSLAMLPTLCAGLPTAHPHRPPVLLRRPPAAELRTAASRAVALAKVDSIRDSRADYPPAATPCPAKLSINDSRLRSALPPFTK